MSINSTRQRSILEYLRLVDIGFKSFLPSVLLSCAAAIVNLYLLRLLFPLIHGIIAWDFSSVLDVPVLGKALLAQNITSDQSGVLLVSLAFWIYLVTIGKCLLNYCSSWSMHREAAIASTKLRALFFARALTFGKMYFDRSNIARLNATIIQSARWVHAQFSALQGLFSDLFLLLGYLVAMASASWRLTLTCLCLAPILQIVSRKSVKKIRQASVKHEQALSDLHARTMQTLFGMTLVQGSGQMESEVRHLREIGEQEAQYYFQAQKLKSLTQPIQEVSGTTIQLLVASVLAVLVSQGPINTSDLIVFFLLATRAIPLTGSLLRFSSTLAEHSGAMKQLDVLLSDEGKHQLVDGTHCFTGLKQAITVSDLSFSYSPDAPVLKKTSFSVPAGSITGLLGSTGSGKSTFAALLLRFYDCEPGKILLDGKDIREHSINSLRSRIAYAGQEPIIFEDTLRKNICYGLTEQPSEELVLTLFKRCRLEPLLRRLSSGLDTKVGERGGQLSGGEKQRIALIRALLRPADIFIFDEPTSALDVVTEKAVLQVIKDFAHNKTTLIISHRSTTLDVATYLVNLELASLQEEALESCPAPNLILQRQVGL